MLPDRHLLVKPGVKVHTGYVPIFDCELACRERMASGDVDRAYQKLLQLGEDSLWPCPNGHWVAEGSRRIFLIEDGRHEWIASVMLGRKYILVAWLEEDRS
jgi:hypothetical protein